MLKILRYRSLLKNFETTEKFLRPDIYNYLNKHLRNLIQKKVQRNKTLLNWLNSHNIKWFKFRGIEEIETIPITHSQHAEQGLNPLKYRKTAMSAALRRILAWNRYGDNKVVWITPNKNLIIRSGLTKSSRIISYPQDFKVIIKKLNRYTNYVLAARPAILAQLAFYIRYNKIQVPSPSLIIAFNHDFTNGALSLLKDTFNVPIVRLITDAFCGSLIVTCRYNHYHLFEPLAYHEIVNSNGIAVTNGRGQLVVTPLHTEKPSILRYHTGIEVIPNKNAVCPCGLSYRTIDNLSYTVRPTLKAINSTELLIPLSEELHQNIVGVNYEQTYNGEVLITIKEYEVGKHSPNDYKAWFGEYWKHNIRITIVIDNRSSFLGDSSLSNYQIHTN